MIEKFCAIEIPIITNTTDQTEKSISNDMEP